MNQKIKSVQEIAQPTLLLSSAVDGEIRWFVNGRCGCDVLDWKGY